MAIAFRNNVGIKIAEAAVQSGQLARFEIGRSKLPQVRLGAGTIYAPTSGQFGYDPAISNGGQVSAQVIVQEPLYDGGARGVREEQFDVDLDRFRTEQLRSERDLRFSVRTAFIDVQLSQEATVVLRKTVEELSDYLALVTRLFKGGGVNNSDVLKTQVSFENAQMTLEKSLQGYRAAKISLAEAMGTARDTSFAVAGTIDVPVNSTLDSIGASVEIDTLRNLELRLAGLDIQRSMLDVQLSHTERLPTVSLTGDFGLLTSLDNLRLPSQDRANMVGYSFGVSIENLLFNWGATDLRTQQRQLDVERAKLNYEQQRRSFIAERDRLRNDIAATIDRLRSLKRTLKVADDNFILTKAQYAGGGSLAFEVLSAEQFRADLRLAELQTQAELRKLLAKLEHLRSR